MHDNGHTRRFRMGTGVYRTLCILALLLPIIGVGALTLSYKLWEKNSFLAANTHRLELASREARATAEKLTNLKALLDHQDQAETGAVLQNLARQNSKNPATPEPQLTPAAGDEAGPTDSGPGHGEFPVVDTKAVSVENINARLLNKGKIRINLDLRNPDPKKSIAGHVRCSFIAGSGEARPLTLSDEQADFKINRFKRAVFQPTLPADVDTVNSRIIIEVFLDEDNLVYRNIFPVER